MRRTRLSPRALAGIVILLAWGATLGWLAQRRAAPQTADQLSRDAALRLSPDDAWFALEASGVQIGLAGVTLDTLSPGYRVVTTLSHEIPRGDGVIRATRQTRTRLSPTLQLVEASSRLSVGGARQEEWGLAVFGDTLTAQHPSELAAGRRLGATEVPQSFDGLPFRLAMTGGLVPGRRREVPLAAAFPPTLLGTRLEVDRESTVVFSDSAVVDERGTWRVALLDTTVAYATLLDGPQGPIRAWIDRRGMLAGVEPVFGATWVRRDFDLVVTAWRRVITADTAALRSALPRLDWYATAANADTGTSSRRLRATRRDGRAIDPALLQRLADGRQRLVEDRLVILDDPGPGGPRAPRPVAQDALVDPDAPAVAALAARLGAMPDGLAGMEELVTTLPSLVVLDVSDSAAYGATQTARLRRGRPEGIARLAAALLQRQGFTARMVTGILPTPDGVLTHAWVEVWRPGEGGWLAVDPVLGRVRASTGLIRLAIGGTAHPDDLVPWLADVRFDLLDGSAQ
jgi:transglutaminase-like putative cysteine protease